jgi:hypothetical protein
MQREVDVTFPRYIVEYKGLVWNVEAILFGTGDNARVRIGRTHDNGQYEWDLVFEKELTLRSVPS